MPKPYMLKKSMHSLVAFLYIEK